jgi:hypothetical protein
LNVLVEHTPDAYLDRAENLMVWIDGVLVTQVYGGNVNVVYDDTQRTSYYTYWFTPDTSRRNQVHITIWPRSSPTFPAIAEITFDPVPPPIIRSAFHGTVDCFGPNTLDILTAANFNCITNGAFINPADNPTWGTFERWRDAWEGYIYSRVVLAAKNAGLMCLLTGDDFFRSPAERNWLLTSPWAKNAVQHTAKRLGEAGCVIGLELIDEFNAPLDDPATVTFLEWWREVCDIPVAFPYHALAQSKPWEAEGDYLSRFGTLLEWRDYSITGQSVWQWWNLIQREATNTAGKRWLSLVSCCGDFYRHPEPVLRPGIPPEAVLASAWLALAAGASGLRYYALDTWWVAERANAQPGQECQTGAAPRDVRWEALVQAFTSIADRENLLSQTPSPPAYAFPWVIGQRGTLRWAVNVSSGSEQTPFGGVLLTPSGTSSVVAGASVPTGGVVLSE